MGVSNIKKKLTTQVVNCQRCSKRLRVPIKPGKRLSIECAGCGLEFVISFKNPAYEVFQFHPHLGLKGNLTQAAHRYAQLPDNVRLKFMALMCCFVLFFVLVSGAVVFAFS